MRNRDFVREIEWEKREGESWRIREINNEKERERERERVRKKVREREWYGRLIKKERERERERVIIM